MVGPSPQDACEGGPARRIAADIPADLLPARCTIPARRPLASAEHVFRPDARLYRQTLKLLEGACPGRLNTADRHIQGLADVPITQEGVGPQETQQDLRRGGKLFEQLVDQNCSVLGRDGALGRSQRSRVGQHVKVAAGLGGCQA